MQTHLLPEPSRAIAPSPRLPDSQLHFTSAYEDLLDRLCKRSVTKHFDAYADVDWDAPNHAIVAGDPRFALTQGEPLESTGWYRAQPAEARARIGLHLAASRMKVGVAFESILSRGLLEFAETRPRGSLEFRYAYHEVIEEAQHSLMFQEFVNRAGFDVRGMGAIDSVLSRRVPKLGRAFPELFFLHVLAGESPIDYLQKRTLARTADPHPLLRRIMQIHVTEEARHVCFASRFLEEHVPRLSGYAKSRLRLFAPFVLRGTVASMMQLPPDLIRDHAIPRDVVRETYRSPLQATLIKDGLRPVHALCEKLDLISPRTAFLWRWLGIGSDVVAS